MKQHPQKEATILIGHGGVARDTPRELVSELKTLEGQRMRSGGGPMSEREAELDDKVRNWPRTPETDPYKFGLERLADALRARLGGQRLEIAYNEFCAPSIEDAVSDLVRDGVDRIAFITTMFTPGGSHSEFEIPQILEELQREYPQVDLVYAWPFDMEHASGFLADQLERVRARSS